MATRWQERIAFWAVVFAFFLVMYVLAALTQEMP